MNPLAPLFVPVQSGLSILDQAFWLLKHQLVGFCKGVSLLGDGRFSRPFGIRAVDLAIQEYEGTVTIFPQWDVSEMAQFLSNFDEKRAEKYMMDGERATWIHLPVIRSLCEVEFTLDKIAAELQSARAAEASDAAAFLEGSKADPNGNVFRGKLPSYVSLTAYGLKASGEGKSDDIGTHLGVGHSGLRVASNASMINLAGVFMNDGPTSLHHTTPSIVMAPMPMS